MKYITGASGFVGSHLVTRVPSYEKIPHELIYTTKLKNPEVVYFLSSYGNMAYQQDENIIIRANLLDLIHLLRQIDFTKLFSFVYFSTSSVKLHIQTFYSRVKRMAEELLLAYAEKYNAPICIIRPFSITGVGEQKEHLIPKLIDSCLHGTEMPFVEHASHDYIDVEDIVNGVMTLSSRRARGIFELGTGTSYTNLQVKTLVEHATKKKANIKLVTNMRAYDNDNWVSTNFRARQYGWSPKKTLADSIKEMVYEAQRK